jgi:predicted nucleic acid-binding protein
VFQRPRARTRGRLRARAVFRSTSSSRIWLDETIVRVWEELHAGEKQRGNTVGDNDLWIASTAIARGMELVTCDQHFTRMQHPGLTVTYLQTGTPPGR